MKDMDFTIGEVSRASGVKVPTIRFYEKSGLIDAPPRSEGGRRLYGESDIRRLRFIRHARELGFELEDIRELLAMSAQPQDSCHHVDSIASRHLAGVEERIQRLQSLREELQRMILECGHGRVCECRVLQVLGDHQECAHEQH